MPAPPSGGNFRQTNGASWREVLDVGDWDRSLMTNVPGESGDPTSKHYSDLAQRAPRLKGYATSS